MSSDCSSNSTCSANSMEKELPGIMEGRGTLKLVFTVVSAVMVGLVMFSFGCSVEIRKLWSHLRRPWGIAVGLLCQFGLMPVTGYLLAIGFSLKPFQAIAVLIMGCCPGGTISNVLTFWVDGDMDLRIILKHVDPVVEVNEGVTDDNNIHFASDEDSPGDQEPDMAKSIFFDLYHVGAIVGGILLLVVAVTGVVLSKGWNTDVTLLIIGFIFPLVGHVTGFLLAFLTHQSWQRCRTISIETGAQNIQVCIAMLQLSFTAEYLAQLFNFALAYGLFQVLHGLLIVTAYQAYKRRQKSKHRRQHPDCPEVGYEKQPRETSAFLEESDGAAVTLRPSGPEQQHRAAE
ncbi:Solute carrier family 10 member 6 [Cricetulus griseus]|uniref:Solute carrier family 10 member 6 n=1 Tax=Cricetulus griseus TaxID=10029 RepID=G3IEM7_CRIGR|nr:Solute carrier family 10 member 6 [Cricetulus griseus]